MSKIVSLSEASSIAIHAVVIIATSKNSITVNSIAEATGASRNHLAKVMQTLVKHDIVKSTRGPTGGFTLNKPPEQVSLLDIYECIEGKITSEGCPLNRQICPFDKCIMGGVVKKLTNEIKDYLAKEKLDSYIIKK